METAAPAHFDSRVTSGCVAPEVEHDTDTAN